MIEITRDSILNQYQAALSTIEACLDRCPDDLWDAPIGNLSFCQVSFHALFFADYYLEAGENVESLRGQAFHRDNTDAFRDYEELLPRVQEHQYERDFIEAYITHCRAKATTALAAETEASLAGPCGFPPKTFSRLELHVYNLRHLQHHAAQLSLRLLHETSEGVRWYGSGP